MIRGMFVGVLLTIAVKLLGWETIETTLHVADVAAKRAMAEAETQAQHFRKERKP